MDAQTAIKAFYEFNGFDPVRVADPLDSSYDGRLAALPQQVDRWLQCVEEADRDAFLTLLSRYQYLSRVTCQLRYGQILNELADRLLEWGISLAETMFVTVEAGGAEASGSNNVSADLRFRNLGLISKTQVIVSQSQLLEEELQRYRAVLFLDDVIGSGMTMWRSIWQLRTRFPEWLDRQRVFCAGIAPRQRGVDRINRSCRKHGISLTWLYRPEWVQRAAFAVDSPEYRHLELYERLIGEYMTDSKKSFFMGFQKNRLLLSFYYNTPNNTLSTFWRIGPGMEPPFFRDGDQAERLALKEMKEQKRQTSSQAYQYGVDRRGWKRREGESAGSGG